MKFIKKCPLLFLLVASGIYLSLTGMLGRASLYKDIELDAAEAPYLSLVMEGMQQGIRPGKAWEELPVEEAVKNVAAALSKVLRRTGPDESVLVYQEEDGLEEAASKLPGEGTKEAAIESQEPEPDREAVGDQEPGSETEAVRDQEPGPETENDELPEAGRQEEVSALEVEEGQQEPSEMAGAGPAASDAVEGKEIMHSFETVTDDQDQPQFYYSGKEIIHSFETVTEDYFNDAVFIGDSRTVGMFEYGGIEGRADFFAKISLTIYDVFTEPIVKDGSSGRKLTVEEALKKKQYGKVYLMLGINEMGTGTLETFMEEYQAVVGRLRELQPDAIIFVQGIMRVTGSKDERDPVFNNTNINARNAEIAKLADDKNIFYIDVNEVVCDEEGNLNSEFTVDEIHLKARYYELWKQFLLEHGIVRDGQ